MAVDVAFQFCSCASQCSGDFAWVVLFFVSEVSWEDSLLLDLWLIKGCAFEVRMWEIGKS